MKCPICWSNRFNCDIYKEEYWGALIIVERHGSCPQCGYTIEQSYSPIMEAFYDIKKGYKRPDGTYVKKNTRKHKRYRRRSKIKLPINPDWVFYV